MNKINYWSLAEVEEEIEYFEQWKHEQWWPQIRFALEYALLASLLFTSVAFVVSLFFDEIRYPVLVAVAVGFFLLFSFYGLVDFIWLIRARNKQYHQLRLQVEAGEDVIRPQKRGPHYLRASKGRR